MRTSFRTPAQRTLSQWPALARCGAIHAGAGLAPARAAREGLAGVTPLGVLAFSDRWHNDGGAVEILATR